MLRWSRSMRIGMGDEIILLEEEVMMMYSLRFQFLHKRRSLSSAFMRISTSFSSNLLSAIPQVGLLRFNPTCPFGICNWRKQQTPYQLRQRVSEVGSGFEPLYEVLQTSAQPLGHPTIFYGRQIQIISCHGSKIIMSLFARFSFCRNFFSYRPQFVSSG